MKIPVMTIAMGILISTTGFSAEEVTQSINSAPSEPEATNLVWVREEEKLARDTYLTLYERWGERIFSNISRSEQKHMDAMLTLLNTYGITDPVTDNTVGVFNDPVLADLYIQLVAQGSETLAGALQVGGFIEELDIRDIQEAIEGTTQADITLVYESLLAGSYSHLNAFVRVIESLGINYEAQVLPQSEVDAILGNSKMTAAMADGGWAVPGHLGEGITIDVTTDGMLVMFWMTYDGDGNQLWLVGITSESSESVIHMAMNQYSGPVFGPAFDNNDLVSESWGEVTINFLDCANAKLGYESVQGYGAGEMDIERVYFAAGSLCQPE